MFRTFLKSVAAIAAALLLVGCAAPAPVPNAGGPDHAVLQFKADGTFKIMSISDIQDGADPSPYAIQLITLALDKEKPDLVVLDGDNIFDWAPSLLVSRANVKKSIDTFMAPIIAREIPFAVVFGNHDANAALTRPEQWAYYQSLPGAQTFGVDANQIGNRVGNYNLLVDGTDNKPAMNLWFFDSGGETLSALGDAMLPGQIDWYKNTSDTIKQANDGVAVPSVVFQHIPVPQIYDLLTPVDKSTPGAIEGSGAQADKYFLLDPAKTSDGTLGEGPCPLENDTAEFAAWQSQGDVMAAVFGHDHDNSFRGTTGGIQLMYDASAGFYSYGNGDLHGVRVLEFNENSVNQFTTHMDYWKDLTTDTIPADLAYDGGFAHGAQWAYIAVAVVIVAGLVTAIVAVVRKVRRRRRQRAAAKETPQDE